MALSTLKIGHNRYGLWDSQQKRYVLVEKTSEGASWWKNVIEESQQQQANKEHFERLKTHYIKVLTAPGSGNTMEQANEFLKSQMPFLYEGEENKI